MNLRETQKILEVLQAAFPSFYRGMEEAELLKVIKLWSSMFADEPYSVVAPAVKALIATKVEGYPPTIGAVKEQIVKLTQKEELSELDAWALVSKACQNGTFGYKKEFEKLPEVVQRAVGSPEQLREWARMDADTVGSVVASNFMRTFKVKKQQHKELSMLPSDVKTLIAQISAKLPEMEQKEPKRLEPSKPEKIEISGIIKTPEKVSEENTQTYKPAPKYSPPTDEEWLEMRAAAIARLDAARKEKMEVC